jgi:SAM-dependent methyltransferase
MGASDSSVRRDWNELAVLDPFWAILSDNTKQFDRWSQNEFFQTGMAEIAAVMNVCSELGYPRHRQRSLDFGCGVGRLTRALRNYFPSCLGVDISEPMIVRARELNPDCDFKLLGKDGLKIFPDRHFDMIYSNIVLQHQPSTVDVRTCISDFLRILTRDGLLVFQLPHYIPLRYRLQPRRRFYHALRAMGVRSSVLYNKLRLNPIRMLSIPENDVLAIIEAGGGIPLRVISDQHGGPHIQSRTYYVTRR